MARGADSAGNSIAGCAGGGAPNSCRARTWEGDGWLYFASRSRGIFDQRFLFYAAERSQDSSWRNYSEALGSAAGGDLCSGNRGIRMAFAPREFRIVIGPRIIYRGGDERDLPYHDQPVATCIRCCFHRSARGDGSELRGGFGRNTAR